MSTTTTTTTAVDRLLEIVVGTRAAAAAFDDVYAPDATIDSVVPGWRFASTGDQIVSQLADWFNAPGELEELERLGTSTGEVVSYTVASTDGAGVPFAARHVHVLTVIDDRIVREQVWCGGRWPAPLLAEMDAASR
jgi:hypothetical protein